VRRGYVITFHAGQLATSAHFGDRHLDAAPRQVDRERQPNWPAADDQHLGIDSTAHEITQLLIWRSSQGRKSFQNRRRFLDARLDSGGIPPEP
jgi:hypothetical protein